MFHYVLFLMDRDCIEKSRKRPGESTGNKRAMNNTIDFNVEI